MRYETLLLALVACLINEAHSGSSDFGTTGLIKMPSARMVNDGTFSVTISADEVADVFNATYQVLPRIQATFRYSILNPRQVNGSIDNNRDRSYEVKGLLLQETSLLPSISIGARDVLGTGVFEGEYVVASKRSGPLDVTLGIGWGRLGSRASFTNPFALLSKKFEDRPNSAGGRFGGEDRGKSFFRGRAAVFGGAEYQLHSVPVSLIVEYESDDYNREVSLGTIEEPSGFNLGLSWRPTRDTMIRFAWLRGDSFGMTLSSQIETKKLSRREYKRNSSSVSDQNQTSMAAARSWYDRLLHESENSGLYLRKGKLSPVEQRATLVVENRSYNLEADALNQIFSLSELYLPSEIKRVDALIRDSGILGPSVSYELQREKYDFLKGEAVGATARNSIRINAPRKLSNPSNVTGYGFPRVAFGADLAGRVQLMDPVDPARKQLYLKLTSRFEMSENLNFWATFEQNLYNDFSAKRKPDSDLPNVRSAVNKYLVNGESGIESLYLEDKRSLSPKLHTRIYAGVLETMFSGIGGEVLYSPYLSRWALGANVNVVKQRGYSKDFRHLDYKTTTGHLSIYYAEPWYNFDFALHVGRYLAKDVGYTFEARRTFDSGFSFGAFFTRTNVPAELFGEGGFDKGFFVRIPFDRFLPGNTKSSYSTVIRPLERDGGRRLENFSGNLWFSRRGYRFDALDRNAKRIMPK